MLRRETLNLEVKPVIKAQREVKERSDVIVKTPRAPDSTSYQKIFILSLYLFSRVALFRDLCRVSVPQKGRGFEVVFLKARQHINKCF